MTGLPLWLFRVASTPQDGAGHVMRCLALARAMAGRFAPLFLLCEQGGGWRARLGGYGMAAGPASEIADCDAAGVVLDHYGIGPAEDAGWRAQAGVVAVIDDFGTAHPGADLVIGPTPGRDGDRQAGVPALLGPRYALIDPALSRLSPRPATVPVGRILVAMGAADNADASSLVLDALALPASDGFAPEIRVVLGGDAPHLARVRSRIGEFGGRLAVDVDLPGLAAAYRWADMAVGAGGVGLLERMAAGVPAVTLTTADNQRAAVAGAARHGGTVAAGALDALSAESLGAEIRALAADADRRSTLAARGRQLVDGHGPERVADALAALASGDPQGQPWQRA